MNILEMTSYIVKQFTGEYDGNIGYLIICRTESSIISS